MDDYLILAVISWVTVLVLSIVAMVDRRAAQEAQTVCAKLQEGLRLSGIEWTVHKVNGAYHFRATVDAMKFVSANGIEAIRGVEVQR